MEECKWKLRNKDHLILKAPILEISVGEAEEGSGVEKREGARKR